MTQRKKKTQKRKKTALQEAASLHRNTWNNLINPVNDLRSPKIPDEITEDNCVFSIVAYHDVYDECDSFRLFGSNFLDVETLRGDYTDFIKQPMVGNKYCDKYSPAVFEIVAIKSPEEFYDLLRKEADDYETEMLIKDYKRTIQYFIHLKLDDINDDDDDDDTSRLSIMQYLDMDNIIDELE